MKEVRIDEIVRLLARHRVEFVVVGMAAGVLQGAPSTTFDLDIVHRRTPDNVDRLLGVLASIHAVARHDDRKLSPGASHLLGPGHQLMTTDYGDLDCLGTLDNDRTYDDLLGNVTILQVEGFDLLVLDLPTLIEVKRRAGRPKDLAAIPVLEATLDEARRQESKV